MEKSKLDVTSGLSWIGTILQWIKDYGIWGIIKACVVLVFMSLVLRLVYNPTIIFDKYNEYIKEKHQIELEERTKYDQKLKNLLPVFLYKYRADRVWVIQYHNGTMDWLHGTMRFELCRDKIPSIKAQYDDFNLTWLDLPYYLRDNEMFIGDMSEVKKIDKMMWIQLEKNCVEYLACIVIRDDSGRPIGTFGTTWSNIPELDKHKIHDYLLSDRGEIKSLIKEIEIEK